MSHVPYEWAMSHHVHVMEECEWVWMGRVTYWRSHVPYEWVMSHMNESCPIWMSHVPHEWVMSHMNGSCPIWMSHVTSNTCNGRVRMSLNGTWHILKESCPMWMGHVPYEWVMSHMNESCPTWMGHVPHEWVMSHQIHILEGCEWVWVGHVTYWRSHVPYEWVMSSMNESCPISKRHVPYEWAMSHQIHVLEECKWIWMSHVTYKRSHVPYD